MPADEAFPTRSAAAAASRAPWLSPAAARRRARRIRALRYGFDLRIDACARTLRGSECIDCTLDARGAREPLVLDYRPAGGAAAIALARRSLRVNGHTAGAGARFRAGHIELDPRLLCAGSNRIELELGAPILAAGGALTRYRDAADGTSYVYTLLVPADASTLFACFDQPDLKARFELAIAVPRSWRVIANAPRLRDEASGRSRRLHFTPTAPISPYLFAFAAGPFVPLAAAAAPGTLWVRRSQARRARRQCDEILRLNAHAVRACSRYFGHRFPFAKYDLVAIPELPYRGMEHAGATFLAEKDVLLPADAGAVARWERAQLIGHETAHQWAGNLVTMTSFDDLWLKEGFANFMAYRIGAAGAGRTAAAIAFHRLKAQAYQADAAPASSPLHRPLADMAQAKCAYDAIVYAKAPAVLRQLEALLGAQVFARGVRLWIVRHAYATADWRDLIRALEQASGRSLREWARAWILRPGVPRMTVHVDDHSAATAVVHMRLDAGARANPVRMQMGATAHDGRLAHAHTVVLDRAQTKVCLPTPAAGRHSLVIDADDSAYAIIRGDARFIAATAASLTALRSPLHRMQAWERLWQAVRDRDLDPASYAWYAIAHLDAERQPMIVAAVVQRLESSERLLAAERADALARALDEFVLAQASMSDPELRNVWLNALASCARTPQGWARLERIASGKLAAARTGGPALRRRSALMLVLRGAWSERQALRALAGEREHPPQFRLQLEAARPDAAGKARLLERFLGPGVLADEAICATLGLFNHPAHAALTLPLLNAALRALPVLYHGRKIFFVDRWIGAFVGGQCSEPALACLRRVLARGQSDPALARKLIDAGFELAGALAIRRRWSDGDPRPHPRGAFSAAAGSRRSARTARRPGG